MKQIPLMQFVADNKLDIGDSHLRRVLQAWNEDGQLMHKGKPVAECIQEPMMGRTAPNHNVWIIRQPERLLEMLAGRQPDIDDLTPSGKYSRLARALQRQKEGRAKPKDILLIDRMHTERPAWACGLLDSYAGISRKIITDEAQNARLVGMRRRWGDNKPKKRAKNT